MGGMTREDQFPIDLMDYIRATKGWYWKIPGECRSFLKSMTRYAKINSDTGLNARQLRNMHKLAAEFLCTVDLTPGYMVIKFGDRTFNIYE